MLTQQNSLIFRKVDSLPSLPLTVSKVLAVTSDPESSVEDLVHAILPDQAMCATILKLANSAFFGIPREIATIGKAVTILGFNEVHNIVLGKAVFNSFKDISHKNRKAIDLFWEHSFTCGLAAKIVAPSFRCSPGELFIAGLIHDIGKLAIFVARPDDYLQILELPRTDPLSCKELEIEIIGIDHEEVGIHLLNRWLFPDTLLCAVGFHHRPQACTTNPLYAVVVQIANAMSLLEPLENASPGQEFLPLFETLQPGRDKIWRHYGVTLSEVQLQTWMLALSRSKVNDVGVFGIFDS